MRSSRLMLGLLLATLTACGSVYHVGDAIIDRPKGTPREDDPLLTVNLDSYKFPENRKDPASETAYVRAATDTTGMARDRLQMDLLTAADKHCAGHKARALATFNNINLVSGLFSAGLAGAASVAKGEIAKRLAAGAGFAQAAKTEANIDIYRQALIEAVFKALDNERQRLEQVLRAKRGKPLVEYSVDESVHDAFRYADACSIYQGVQFLNDAVNRADPCKVLRDRQAVLSGDLVKTLPDVVRTETSREYERNAAQLAACAGK
jgi:hypothetical protein